VISIYKINKNPNGPLYKIDSDVKLNTNCPDSEKTGTGPGSCGGASKETNSLSKVKITPMDKISGAKSIVVPKGNDDTRKWKVGQRVTYSVTYKHGEGQYAVTRTDQFSGKISGFKTVDNKIMVILEPKFGKQEEVPINQVYEYMKPAVYATGKARGTGLRGR